MKTINTATGPITTDKLGHCQLHEHIYVADTPAAANRPDLRIDDPDRSLIDVLRFRDAGGSFILDCQPVGAGRNVNILGRISCESGVNIAACTGFHLEKFYPKDHSIYSLSETEAFEAFTGELTDGCAENSEIRAGAVKAAIGTEGCTGRTLTLFRAAARAAHHASVPLIIHTEKGFDALRAIETAYNCGLSGRRILICHADRRADNWEIHESIARAGVMLEYDTISRPAYHDNESEIRLIRHMLECGFEKQLLLSLDTTRTRLSAYHGAIGLDHLLTDFLPRLAASGIPSHVLRTITVRNPIRVFE